jgi:hypothetical protein
MDTIYLHVPPEEYAEVKAAGASWDDASKRWYVRSDRVSPVWARCLGDGAPGEESEFGVISDEAFVAVGQASCVHCHEVIEVIAIYGESGVDTERGEPIGKFTLSNVWGMDDALLAQLAPWPSFRLIDGGDSGDDGGFATLCPHCGAVQEDYLLHSEPGDVFFCIPGAEVGAVLLMPLDGTVRMSGDLRFAV